MIDIIALVVIVVLLLIVLYVVLTMKEEQYPSDSSAIEDATKFEETKRRYML